MRSPRPKSRIIVAGFALLSLLTVPGPAPADVYFETVYGPTSSVVTMPTSSVLSTSYVVPSSYLSTTYLPTSYTSYIPTSYTSSYIPTSYTSSAGHLAQKCPYTPITANWTDHPTGSNTGPTAASTTSLARTMAR